MLNFETFSPTIRYIRENNLFNDLYIREIGFDNFQHITPYLHSRVQPHYTLHFVVGGQGFLHVQNKNYQLKSGDIFFLPPNIQFKYYPLDEDPWKYIWITVNGEKAKEYFNRLLFNKKNLIYHCKNEELLKSVFYDFICNNPQNSVNEENMLSLFFKAMAILAEERTPQENRVSFSKYYLEEIQSIISANFKNIDFKIEDLSAITHLSYPYLIKIFKKHMNISLKKYLYTMRLEHALHLLITTDAPITEISYDSGFSDPLYFSTAFKKFYKMPPTEYRKKYNIKDA